MYRKTDTQANVIQIFTNFSLIHVVDRCLLHVVFVDRLVKVHVSEVDDGRKYSVDGVHLVVVETQRLKPVYYFLELTYVVLSGRTTLILNPET